jgi:hypothetical protein
LRQYVGAAQVYPSLNLQPIFLSFYAAFCLFVRTLPIDFALLGRKRKYIKSKTTGKLKKTNLDRRGPRPIPIICHLPDSPSFSLPTTFNQILSVPARAHLLWKEQNLNTALLNPFISITPSKPLMSSGSWLTLHNFEIFYLLAVNYDPVTTDLFFIRVNIYPGPGEVGSLLIF